MGFLLATTATTACAPPDRDEDDSQFRVLPSVDIVLPREVPLAGAGVLTRDRLDVGKDVTIDDRDELATWVVGGLVGSDIGAGARLGKASSFADVLARGSLALGDSTVVNGDVVAAGGISMGPNAWATSVHPSSTLATPRTLTVQTTFPAPTGSYYLQSSGPKYLELAPGSYDQVSVEADTELVLAEGTYHIRRLKLGAKGLVTFAAKEAPSIVYVGDELLLDGSVESDGPVANAAFVYMGNLDVNVAGPFAAHLIAPLANVSAGADGAAIVGGIVARALDVEQKTTFEREPFAAWAQLLALSADPPPAVDHAWLAPAECETPEMCCHATMTFVTGTAAKDKVDVTTNEACVVSEGGDDSIAGFASNAIVIAGTGHDLVSMGTDVRVHGGAGNDLIETLGDSIVFGNAGDDHIIVPGGTNIVTPGPNKDVVELGPGNDTIVIADACEVVAGEVLDAGDGEDTLVTPLTLQQLAALGVIVRNVEHVTIEQNGCMSECRAVPECAPAGVCVENAVGNLSCACDSFAEGTDCAGDNAPKYESVPPPYLGAVPSGTEQATAEAFVDWMVRARVGDEKSILGELDHARTNPALRDAFISLLGHVFTSRRPEVVIPAVEAVAYLRCKACEKQLREIVATPLSNGGDTTYSLYGKADGNEVRHASIAIARAAIGGLAFQATKSSRAELLTQIATHPDHEVRLMAIQALRSIYGSTLDADIAAVAQPGEIAELNRPF